MILGLKDCFNVKGRETKLGQKTSKLTFIAPQNASLIELIGSKATLKSSECTSFCVGVLDHSKVHFNGLSAGASSSGSAWDLEHHLIDAAITTCTGGSTIVPASRLNCFGFKPTYGRISRYGLVPLCSFLDTVSLMAWDINLLQQVFAWVDQPDPKDLNCLKDFERTTVKGSKIVVAKNLFTEAELQDLKAFEAETLELDSEEIEGAYFYLLCPDFYSNMCRFTGLFHKDLDQEIVLRYNLKTLKDIRSSEFNSEIKSRIVLGRWLLEDYDYTLIDKFIQKYESRFKDYYWILPVAEKTNSLTQTSYCTINNLLKRPTITFPNKFSKGLMISGPKNSDWELLKMERLFQDFF